MKTEAGCGMRPQSSTRTRTRKLSETTSLLATASRTSTRSNTVSLSLRPQKFYQDLTFSVEKQTVAFNIKARVEFKSRKRGRMGVWEAIELLNTLVDESDPDVS